MRRLLLGAGGGAPATEIPDPPPVEVVPFPDDPIPYAMPTARPYNAPVPCQIDTYDGSDQTLHPTVHDFGVGNTWHGYRYWMCHTPYPLSNSDFENPSIEASNNGWDWHTPAGLTNPIFPKPDGAYNSDPDFGWNPELNRLELIYRPMDPERVVHSYSTNGIDWSPFTTIIPGSGGVVSPSMLRLGPTSWRIYARRADLGLAYWTATTPAGPWSAATECILDPGGIPQDGIEDIWHLDVVQPTPGGRMYFLIATNPVNKLYAAYSDNGINVVVADSPLMENSTDPAAWDNSWLYRASMTPHENGTHFRVWYSGQKDNQPRTGLTQIPLTEWDF